MWFIIDIGWQICRLDSLQSGDHYDNL